MTSQAVVKELVSKGVVDETDVLALRRTMFGDDHRISDGEAKALFQINDIIGESDQSWPLFFVESIVDFLISNSQPRGYISDQQAEWLMQHISQSGIVKSATELEAMIKLMETAQSIPESLEIFAMLQVKNAVICGNGVTRSGNKLVAGKIGAAEIELLRRILYACASRDSAAISRSEAELIFDINDEITAEHKDALWTDFFVKVIANYLMSVRGFQPVSREDALRRESWLNDDAVDIGSFFNRILAGGLRGVADAYSRNDEDNSADRDMQAALDEAIDAREADWLIDRIGNEQSIDDAQRALLMFIKVEASNVHPRLKPLIDQVA